MYNITQLALLGFKSTLARKLESSLAYSPRRSSIFTQQRVIVSNMNYCTWGKEVWIPLSCLHFQGVEGDTSAEHRTEIISCDTIG